MENEALIYAIVSPVRDEEAFLERTIESVLAQTVRPAQWVLVNDGSTDGTATIVDRYVSEHDWIQAVHRKNRGFRSAGSGVMEAFEDGLSVLTCGWNYLVKLDGDMSFEPDYFERCLAKFDADERLGIGGGVIYNKLAGGLQLERHPRFHVRGATKIYRRECWEAIGGLKSVPGWDTLDEVKANMLGWKTSSFPDVSLVQLRFTGDGSGQWSTWNKNGRASYICGYHPLFLLAKAMRRAFHKPYLLASIGVLSGYFRSYLDGTARIDDDALIGYLRGQQMRLLTGRQSIWR